MKYFFIDVVGPYLTPVDSATPTTLIIFMLFTIFAEAVVMLLFKLNRFGKCILDSSIVNIASLIVGFIIFQAGLVRAQGRDANLSLPSWLILFALTTVVEGFLLMLLNRKLPRARIWLTSIVMNLVSYLILFIDLSL
ncbi:MAG: hypothetical protein ACHQF0_00990 [Chitinophagales bacterium]